MAGFGDDMVAFAFGCGQTFAGAAIIKVLDNYRVVEDSFQKMAAMLFIEQDYSNYLDGVLPIPELKPGDSKQKVQRVERIIERRGICSHMFEIGHENDPPETKHTLWTAYNK